jgi:hypothetical protein
MPETLRGRRLVPVLIALACLSGPGTAAAWGAKAHRVVGHLAQSQLHPQAAAAVATLLAGEADPTLAGVAYWADEQREAGSWLGRRTARWHFVNLPRGTCAYLPARDCPDGDCVIGAINRQRARLGDASLPARERAEALKYLVHLVADVHQPLHAGHRDDRGGNEVQLHFQGEGWNLHSTWDRLLPARRRLAPAAYADVLRAQPPLPVDPTLRSDRKVAEWAMESCRIVQAPGFYPRGHVLQASYLDAHQPIAELRLRQAARRLADLLNQSLSPPAAKKRTHP